MPRSVPLRMRFFDIASPLFTEKPFFSLKSASSHPLPKNQLLCVRERRREADLLARRGPGNRRKHADGRELSPPQCRPRLPLVENKT